MLQRSGSKKLKRFQSHTSGQWSVLVSTNWFLYLTIFKQLCHKTFQPLVFLKSSSWMRKMNPTVNMKTTLTLLLQILNSISNISSDFSHFHSAYMYVYGPIKYFLKLNRILLNCSVQQSVEKKHHSRCVLKSIYQILVTNINTNLFDIIVFLVKKSNFLVVMYSNIRIVINCHYFSKNRFYCFCSLVHQSRNMP